MSASYSPYWAGGMLVPLATSSVIFPSTLFILYLFPLLSVASIEDTTADPLLLVLDEMLGNFLSLSMFCFAFDLGTVSVTFLGIESVLDFLCLAADFCKITDLSIEDVAFIAGFAISLTGRGGGFSFVSFVIKLKAVIPIMPKSKAVFSMRFNFLFSFVSIRFTRLNK